MKDLDLITVEQLDNYPKEEFTQITISSNLINEDFFTKLKNVNSIIVDFKNKIEFQNKDDIFALLILYKFYPLTKGVPFCIGEIKHKSEFFGWAKNDQQELKHAPKECINCIFNKQCPKNTNFQIKAITQKDDYLEIIKFIEEKDESSINWF